MEWSSSEEGEMSEWSSDSDSSEEGKSRPASASELNRAYFTEPEMPGEGPRASMRLRKQQTAYARKTEEGDAVLPRAAGDPRLASLDAAFGAPMGDDRETAGYLVDADGKPYARVMESRPPPANVNRKGHSHQRSLRRALGYDPHHEPHKAEVRGVTNGADVLNGDADLADARRAATKGLASRGDSYHNQSHTQEFADTDAGRSLYDGYNVSSSVRAHAQRRQPLEHSWRAATAREHDPARGTTQLPDDRVHAAPRVERTEAAEPFRRIAHGDRSTVQLDPTMDIPVVRHASRREGAAEHHHARAQGVAHLSGARAATGGADNPEGARETADAGTRRPSTGATADAARVDARSAQRAGGDDSQVEREAAITALAGMGASAGSRDGEREGGTDVCVDARAHVATGLAAFGSGAASREGERQGGTDVLVDPRAQTATALSAFGSGAASHEGERDGGADVLVAPRAQAATALSAFGSGAASREGEREGGADVLVAPRAQAATVLSAFGSVAASCGGEREGGTDVSVADRQHAATGLSAFGTAAAAREGNREGGTDVSITARAEAATGLAMFGSGAASWIGQREGGDDAEAERAAAATALVEMGGAHRAAQQAAMSVDVCKVDRAGFASGGAGGDAFRPINAGHDASSPNRARVDHVQAPLRAAAGVVVEARGGVDIGEDRPPVAPCAVWHFPVANGAAGGASGGEHRPAPPTNSSSGGTRFHTDRLAQPHSTNDWSRYDARVAPSQCSPDERLTPVPHGARGGAPPLQQLATGGARMHRGGRSTPLTREARPSPMSLR